MANLLQRCRTDWGASDQIAALPRLHVVSEATYLPTTAQALGGLFVDGLPIGGDVARGDAEMPKAVATEPGPDGPYLYLGRIIVHYGHFVTDVLSRLWPALDWAGERPKLLYHPPEGTTDLDVPAYLADILRGLGFAVSDLVAFDRAVRLRDVVVPEPSFHGRSHVHAVFGALCERAGRPYRAHATTEAAPRPIYLSKTRLRSGVGRMINEPDLVAALARYDIDIVYPEELDFPAQVALFTRGGIVMGTTGSAFHTSLFAGPERRIVGLNWAEAVNSNFALLDRLNRNRAYYYHPHRTRYAPAEAFHVGWIVSDPARVAAELMESVAVFDDLDHRDAAVDAARARAARSLPNRLRRLRRSLAARLRGAS